MPMPVTVRPDSGLRASGDLAERGARENDAENDADDPIHGDAP